MAPLIAPSEGDIIPDAYFVVFKSGTKAKEQSSWVQSLHRQSAWASSFDEEEAGVRHVYDMGLFQGLAGRFGPEVLEEIRLHPDVSSLFFSSAGSKKLLLGSSLPRFRHGRAQHTHGDAHPLFFPCSMLSHS